MAPHDRLSTAAFAGAVVHPGSCFGFNERATVAVVRLQIGSRMEPLLPSCWGAAVSGEREQMVITAYCRNSNSTYVQNLPFCFRQNAHF